MGVLARAREASRVCVWLVALVGWLRRRGGVAAVLACAGAWVRVMACRWSAVPMACAVLLPASCARVCEPVACVLPVAMACRWSGLPPAAAVQVCRCRPRRCARMRGRAGAGLPVAMACRLPVASLPVCRPADLRHLPPRVFTAPGLVS